MQLRTLFDDDSAVSPVIGVILMVAITVILAAVIATFVLGLGDQVSDTAPQASFDFDYEEGGNPGDADFDDGSADGNLTITHSGGASITASQLGITGGAGGTVKWGGSGSQPFGSNSEITAGNSVTYAMNSDETVRVTWESQEGSQSATLQTFDGPDA